MNMNKLVAGIVLLLICGTGWARALENMVDVEMPQRLDGSSYTLDEIQQAVAKGCVAKGWRPKVASEQEIECTITVRDRHYVKVRIPYTETHYSILYVDSREMDYNEAKQTIHRNYANWIINLSTAIQMQFEL
jgi:hypothetical protein